MFYYCNEWSLQQTTVLEPERPWSQQVSSAAWGQASLPSPLVWDGANLDPCSPFSLNLFFLPTLGLHSLLHGHCAWIWPLRAEQSLCSPGAESLRLEKTSKITKSNHQPIPMCLLTTSLRATLTLFWNTPRDGDSPTYLGSLCHCLTTLRRKFSCYPA